ncbi:hypothetical protein ACDT12_12955 [Staphylococcus aureus]
MKAKGYATMTEPRIATNEGTRIPDLCAWSASLYIVCDVAVVADTTDPDRWHNFKMRKYDTPDVHRWMKQNNPIADRSRQKGVITALVMNWRGAISGESWSFLEKIGNVPKIHDVVLPQMFV